MSNCYMGEIRMLGFPFAPQRWAYCRGQYLALAQYTALFALIGATFGGNGQTNFRLPDLQGRMPIGVGVGTAGALPTVNYGQMGGTSTHTLSLNNLPMHNHQAVFNPTGGGSGGTAAEVKISTDPGTANVPDATHKYLAANKKTTAGTYEVSMWSDNVTNSITLGGVSGGGGSSGGGTVTVANTGMSEAFDTISPYTALNFCIALHGLFPQRN